jgi:hypothetical protein
VDLRGRVAPAERPTAEAFQASGSMEASRIQIINIAYFMASWFILCGAARESQLRFRHGRDFPFAEFPARLKKFAYPVIASRGRRT